MTITWCSSQHDESLFLCRFCGIMKPHTTSHIHQQYDDFCNTCVINNPFIIVSLNIQGSEQDQDQSLE